MSDREWRIFVTDRNGLQQCQVTTFSQLDVVIRHRDVGSWSIKLPGGEPAAQLLQQPGSGLILELAMGSEIVVMQSGRMTQIEPKWSESEDETVISGLSDDQLLWDWIVYPSAPDWTRPDGKAFANDAYDVATGVAESVMKHFVVANCLSRPAPGTMPIDIAADLARGGVVTGRGRFQLVGDLLQELAVAGGNLGFGVRSRRFDCWVPADRSADQIFSAESGNLTEYSGKTKAPTVTAPLVAGGGDTVDRVFQILSDLDAEHRWGRHIERFYDRRDTTDLGEMRQTASQALIDGAEVSTIDLRAIDRPNRQFGKDWSVGDIVTQGDIPSVVNSAAITLDDSGTTITPTMDSVTTVTAQSVLAMFDAVRSLRRQVAALQRMK